MATEEKINVDNAEEVSRIAEELKTTEKVIRHGVQTVGPSVAALRVFVLQTRHKQTIRSNDTNPLPSRPRKESLNPPRSGRRV